MTPTATRPPTRARTPAPTPKRRRRRGDENRSLTGPTLVPRAGGSDYWLRSAGTAGGAYGTHDSTTHRLPAFARFLRETAVCRNVTAALRAAFGTGTDFCCFDKS